MWLEARKTKELKHIPMTTNPGQLANQHIKRQVQSSEGALLASNWRETIRGCFPWPILAMFTLQNVFFLFEKYYNEMRNRTVKKQ